ncbi:exo 1,3/1,4-beta-D-glucan glucohydrolase [Microbulbifer agarilyticus]|uniref:glycoside hydrolase family 3 protein n=1 Tax=Microbulbifer agarilyticus TaxID=260552 RepID=UPI001C9447BA|nr:exo 1,3/1,4-beta-D-glucan glucohydrolase [Microbulbifer agarilyticus]MBY6211317.1 exo 1,3/1,4-beta-D-glucan glucohydrolase [Microbulbifer agarilyticus]
MRKNFPLLATAASSLLLVVAGCERMDPQSEYSAQQISWPSAPIAQAENPDAGTANSASGWPKIASEVQPNSELEQRAAELLATMTLEQKVGQIIQTEIKFTTPDDVRDFHLGSVLNGGGSFPGNNKYATPEDWIALADKYYFSSMDTSKGGRAIPIIWGTDAVHGHNNVIGATLFPHNIGLGATRNPELMRKIGEVTAREVAVTGIDWLFAPTVAAPRDDHWGRTYEGYSEDPELIYQYAGEIVRGIQGDQSGRFGSGQLVATAKHFIGDGGTEGGADRGDAKISEGELMEIHGQGYFSSLRAGVQTVMASFNSWNGEKLHGSHYMLTEVLKEQMGFDGFVVGDWLGHAFVPGCSEVRCAQSINAGLDMFMASNEDWKSLYHNTIDQVKTGEIPQQRLDDAVTRILRVKLRAGLFDAPPSQRPLAGELDIIGSEPHRQVARQAVRESLVLLKNENQLLPLQRELRVLVAGDGADNIGKQSGGWTISWQGTGNSNSDFPGGTSIYDGIRSSVEAAGGVAKLSVSGDIEEGFDADVAIVVFGENPYAEMQGDLKTLEYQAGNRKDLKLLNKLRSQGIPVVSVFLTGRPLWVNAEINASDAFVVAWLPGSEGAAVADVLFRNSDGSINHDFTGKLSFSWPESLAQKVVNRHDDKTTALFEYGFGMSADDEVSLARLNEERPQIDVSEMAELDLFAARPMEPWHLFIGDDQGAELEMTGNRHNNTHMSIAAIDRNMQEDARSIEWLGSGTGSVYLKAWNRLDLSEYLVADGALVAEVRLEKKPSASIFAQMRCGDNCGAKVEVSDLIKNLSISEWQKLSVDLSCFGNGEMDFSKVDMPFQLSTDGTMQLSFSRISIGSPAKHHMTCSS